jgi:transglutaminase-like putative cysteine protease
VLSPLIALWASTALAGPPPSPLFPWDGAPFSASAQEMVSAAAALPAPADRDADVEVLLEESSYVFDESGAHDSTTHVVFRVLTRTGAERWSSVGAEWSPWLEERPVVKARVIAAGGTERTFDASTLAEETQQGAPESFSDRRAVRGPLPGIAQGSVVEELISIRRHRPAVGASERDAYYFGGGAPTRRSKVTIDLPAKLPFRSAVQGTGERPAVTESGGRRKVTVEVRDLPAMKRPEQSMPPEVVPQPRLIFGTARSWNEVARAYAAVVDQQIDPKSLAVQAMRTTGGARGTREVADRLLAWVHRTVRYTGVELASAAIVPRPPEEVLARGYGDCKDLSALMVALLRSVGVPASIALVSPGWSDAPADVAGFGLFTHAVVYVPGATGAEPLWLDPTDWTAPAGQLSPLSLGRQSLIAASDTQGLTRTPGPDPARNVFRVTREYRMAERGRGQLVETTSTQGTISADRRAHLRRDAEDFEQSAEDYLRKYFQADRLTGFEHSDPDDLVKPLTVRLEAEGVRRAYAADVDAAVALTTGILFEHLPAELAPLEEEGEDASSGEKRPEVRRRFPLRVSEPYTAELTATITPAPGFSARALPQAETRALGPATLKRSYALEPGGQVTARFTFDLGRPELSPSEVAAFRRALGEYVRESPVQILFDRVPERLLSAGKVKEAVQEQRKLIALHPAEALHRAQLALLLLRAGAAGAARDEARAATAMDPSLAYAWRVLGIALSADELGRDLHPGADVAGAVAALRQAKELDPKDSIARSRLASLLSSDPKELRHFGSGADLPGAIAELEALRKQLGSHDSDDDYLEALFHAERFRDARKAAAAMTSTSRTQSISLASLAALEGAASALAEAGRVITSSTERRTATASAAGLLMRRRRYPEAAALFGELVSGSENPAALQALVTMLQRVQRHEGVAVKPSDPMAPLKRLMVLVAQGGATEAALGKLLAKNALPREEKTGSSKAATGEAADVAGALRRMLGSSSSDVDVVTDFFFGAELRQEGDDAGGYRVEYAVPNSTSRPIFVVVKEGGEMKLLADSTDLSPLGAEALARTRRGDLAGARKLLDWARREEPQDIDRLPPIATPFSMLWTAGANGDAARVRAAAAALMATGRMRADADGPLREALGKASGPAATALGWALASAHLSKERWADLSEDAGRLMAVGDHPKDAFRLKALALRRLHQWDAQEALARDWLAHHADDLDAQEMLFSLAADRGDFAAAGAAGKRLVEDGRATSRVLNNLAWFALFGKDTSPGALEEPLRWAERAASQAGYKDRFSCNTLAALYAEVGRGSDARAMALRAVELSSGGEADDGYWYVFGRIAEGWGLPEVARAAYGKIKASRDPSTSDPAVLAQRRLAGLPPAAPPSR